MQYRARMRASRVGAATLIVATVAAVMVSQLQGRVDHPRLVSSPAITEYPQPNPPHSGAHGITVGPDGALWYTLPGSNEIGRLTTGGAASFFTVHGAPESIVAGPDGNLWFTEYTNAAVARLTPSGTLTEFTVNASYGYPDGITAGPDGNLWFTYYAPAGDTSFSSTSYVGRVTPAGSINNYPLKEPYAGAMGIAAGPDGNLWVADSRQEAVERVSPAGGAATAFVLNSSITGQPAQIIPGPASTMWFS